MHHKVTIQNDISKLKSEIKKTKGKSVQSYQALGLSTKRSAATTSLLSIRVVEHKSTGVEAVLVIDFDTEQVNALGLIHVYFQAINIKLLVLVGFVVKAQYVAEPGTSATLYAYANAIIGAHLFLGQQPLEFGNGSRGKAYRVR